jgi:hypothetical protein
MLHEKEKEKENMKNIKTFDGWTFGHFIGGFVSSFIIFPKKPVLSFTVSNLLHLFLELNEEYIDPLTQNKINSYKNSGGDIIAYFIGWFLGFILINKLKIKINNTVYTIFLISYIIGCTSEYLREVLIRHGFSNGNGFFDISDSVFKLV